MKKLIFGVMCFCILGSGNVLLCDMISCEDKVTLAASDVHEQIPYSHDKGKY